MEALLRICNVCGIEAHNKNELEVFSKTKTSTYGRRNLCKKCENEWRRTNRSSVKRRKKLIAGFAHPITCHFCNEEIIKLNGQDKDALAIHSLDRNHENWNPKNKVPFHSVCHAKHHAKNLFKDKNPNWKGGVSFNRVEYKRLWRKRRKIMLEEFEQ